METVLLLKTSVAQLYGTSEAKLHKVESSLM